MSTNQHTARAWRACQDLGSLLSVIEHYVQRGERLDALERIRSARATLGQAALALADLHEQQSAPNRPPAWMMPKPAREHVAVNHD